MQQLLSLVFQCSLPVKVVCLSVVELCGFLRKINSKDYQIEDLNNLWKNIVVTRYWLETIFFTSIFDIVVHITI